MVDLVPIVAGNDRSADPRPQEGASAKHCALVMKPLTMTRETLGEPPGRVVRHVEVVLNSRVLGAVLTVVAVLAAGCSGNKGRASRPEPTTIATTTTSIIRMTGVSQGCVVFSRGGPDGGIHALAADGTLRRITTDPGDDQAPWSPDGTKIVFNRSLRGDQSIYVMHANGSGLTRLTAGPSDASPTWSADGSRILFMREAPGRWVWVS